MILRLNKAAGNLPVGTLLDMTELKTRLFSSASFWNKPLDAITENPKSAALVAEFGRNWAMAGPSVNTKQYSTPLYLVTDPDVKRYPVSVVGKGKVLSFTNLHKDLQAGVPIPDGALPADGTDGTCTIWDQVNDILYEFWQFKSVNGVYQCTWGAIIPRVSESDGSIQPAVNIMGGKEEQGASATGLPFIGGTILLEELRVGVIKHALSCAIVEPRQGKWLWPAQRTDGWVAKDTCLMEGQRLAFKKDIVIKDEWCPLIKMMVAAIRDYGLVIRDKSGCVSFYAEDPTQYKFAADPYILFQGGKQQWEIMRQFPVSQLVAL